MIIKAVLQEFFSIHNGYLSVWTMSLILVDGGLKVSFTELKEAAISPANRCVVLKIQIKVYRNHYFVIPRGSSFDLTSLQTFFTLGISMGTTNEQRQKISFMHN